MKTRLLNKLKTGTGLERFLLLCGFACLVLLAVKLALLLIAALASIQYLIVACGLIWLLSHSKKNRRR